MNKRGQALIEFILVLPLLLLLIFAFIDFGRIILCKTHLESVMSDVIELSDSEVSNYLSKDSEYKIKYHMETGANKKIILETNLELITPGLKSILKNPYTVKIERNIL